MNNYYKIIFTAAFLSLLAVITYRSETNVFLDPKPEPIIKTEPTLPTSHQISYKTEWNYRQDYNGCGPFSAAAAMRALGDENVDSLKVGEAMPLRVPRRKSTLPKWIEMYLHRQWYSTQTPKLSQRSDDKKFHYLQSQLAQNKPIILLGDLDGYQHFLTLLWYDQEKNEWYLYDPIQKKWNKWYTIDQNGEITGNTTWDNEQLLQFRNGGGVYGFYQHYALVISTQKKSEE